MYTLYFIFNIKCVMGYLTGVYFNLKPSQEYTNVSM